jgi:hypothetical protein
MSDHVFVRVWQDLMSRPAGPLKFRFVLQPSMAIFHAVLSGLKDNREGKGAFFWDIFVDPVHRRELLKDAWKSIKYLFFFALGMDCAYQIIVLRRVYPFEALVVATFLAIIPYLLVRGPINRMLDISRRGARPLTPKAHRQQAK